MSDRSIILTLVYAHDHQRVLLGMKKRGFGEGRWNGFGGKVRPGEDVLRAACREFEEECAVPCPPLRHAGLITFRYSDLPDHVVHLFRTSAVVDTPSETEEMRPQWFSHADVPYADMWPSDPLWFPQFLRGQTVTGWVAFKDINTVIDHDIESFGGELVS